MGSDIQRDLQDNKNKFMFRGALLVLMGTALLLIRKMEVVRFEEVLGVLLLAGGLSEIIWVYRSKTPFWTFFLCAALIAIGLLVLWDPQPLWFALASAFAILMTFEGLLELTIAFRRHPTDYWGWILLVGLITCTCATFTWMSLRSFDSITLVWMVALNLILYGMLLFMLVWQTKF